MRKTGSGNIGATNVLRTGHKFLAFLTLFLDAGKGVAVAFCGAMVDAVHGDHILDLILKPNGYSMILSFFVILGHCYPVWLKFKGGKGVATTLGVLLVVSAGPGLRRVYMGLSPIFPYFLSRSLVRGRDGPLAAFLIIARCWV
ncbi:MAG: glycerol-3-phosphate acyltransferase [Alphaproteobacteria bacterium]